jgi:hydroxymethylpyrimidine pyrophosphatase-like HAD family hydrolase
LRKQKKPQKKKPRLQNKTSHMWPVLVGLAALCRPRVVFTDCDGTLLRPDHSLSDRSRQTLRALDRAGVLVVPATGRGRAGAWTETVLTELGGGAPGVFCNGCTSFDRDGTALPPALLPSSLPASVLGVLGSAAGNGCVAVAYVGDEALYENSSSPMISRLAAVGDSPLRRVDCLLSACAVSSVSKILLLHDASAMPELRAAVAPAVGQASGGAVTQAIDWMLEVVPFHADKGSAAGELLARWGLG